MLRSRSRGSRRFLREVEVRVGVEKRILPESGVRVEPKLIPGVRVGVGVELKKWLRVRVELILLRLCNTALQTNLICCITEHLKIMNVAAFSLDVTKALNRLCLVVSPT